MMRSSVRILMNSAPAGLALDAVVEEMQSVPGVQVVHHVHVWQLDEHQASLEAHVVIDRADAADLERVKGEVKRCLRERFGIDRSTIEIEFAHGPAGADHDSPSSPGTEPGAPHAGSRRSDDARPWCEAATFEPPRTGAGWGPDHRFGRRSYPLPTA